MDAFEIPEDQPAGEVAADQAFAVRGEREAADRGAVSFQHLLRFETIVGDRPEAHGVVVTAGGDEGTRRRERHAPGFPLMGRVELGHRHARLAVPGLAVLGAEDDPAAVLEERRGAKLGVFEAGDGFGSSVLKVPEQGFLIRVEGERRGSIGGDHRPVPGSAVGGEAVVPKGTVRRVEHGQAPRVGDDEGTSRGIEPQLADRAVPGAWGGPGDAFSGGDRDQAGRRGRHDEGLAVRVPGEGLDGSLDRSGPRGSAGFGVQGEDGNGLIAGDDRESLAVRADGQVAVAAETR